MNAASKKSNPWSAVLSSPSVLLHRYQSRGVTNEDEVVKFIEATYDVNITVVNFGGPVEDAMNLMQQTDLLIGMHGAGKCQPLTVIRKP